MTRSKSSSLETKKFTFILSHSGVLRLCKRKIQELLAEGHEIQVYLLKDAKTNWNNLTEGEGFKDELEAKGVLFRKIKLPKPKFKDKVAISIGLIIDVFLYAHPKLALQRDFYGARVLKVAERHRSAKSVVQIAHWLCKILPSSIILKLSRLFRWFYKTFENDDYLKQLDEPFVKESFVIFAQYLEIGSQTPLMANAIKSKLNTTNIIFIPSWDNLTTKACIKGKIDKIWCWANFQKKEAIYHGFPAKNCQEIGNYAWKMLDRDRSPTVSKTSSGLKSILYVCSSIQIAPDEERDILALLLSRLQRDVEEYRVEIWKHPQVNINEGRLMNLKNVSMQRPNASVAISGEGYKTYIQNLLKHDLIIGQATSALAECAVLGLPTAYYERPSHFGVHRSIHANYLKSLMPTVHDFTDIQGAKFSSQNNAAEFFGVHLVFK